MTCFVIILYQYWATSASIFYLFWIYNFYQSHTMHSHLTNLFHVAQHFPSLSMLKHVSAFYSFLQLKNTPTYEYIAVYLSLHQLMNIQFISTFWLLWLMPSTFQAFVLLLLLSIDQWWNFQILSLLHVQMFKEKTSCFLK